MKKNWFLWIPILLLILLAFSNGIVALWIDWLWFQDLGYQVLFSQQLVAQLSLGLVFGLVCFVTLYGTALLARHLARRDPQYNTCTVFEFPQFPGLKDR